jgi:cellulose synthase/poly-beta-1,6-N-acetylglucosamine synthase-like glycosyltransferase
MILLIFSLAYAGLILYLWIGLHRLSGRQSASNQFISVVIAARNEEKSLPQLLRHLSAIDYSNCEFIIANDRSTDSSPAILRAWNDPRSRIVDVVEDNSGLVGKKRAITRAIEVARGEIIAFCDADSLPGPNWLREIDAHFGPGVDFLFGQSPLIIESGSFFSRLKNLERYAHHSVGAGALGWGWGITCSAVNMAYRRELFAKVGGYGPIGCVPSGDDDLMLQRMAPHARGMTFMFTPEGAVPTYERAEKGQRIQRETRRASKWRYWSKSMQVTAAGVFVYYLLMAAGAVAWLTGWLPGWILAISLLLKLISEWILVSAFTRKSQRSELLTIFPIAEILYVPYYVFFAIRGSLFRYRWR